jgi:hypothetical protein
MLLPCFAASRLSKKAYGTVVLLAELGYQAQIEVSFFALLHVPDIPSVLCARWTEAMQPLFLTMFDLNSPWLTSSRLKASCLEFSLSRL